MSIEKADILTRVNANTQRAETNIDAILLWALLDLSKKGCFLKASTSGTVSSSGTATLPSTFHVEEFVSSDSTRLGKLTYSEHQQGRIRGYAVRGNTLYFPTSYAGKGYEMAYLAKHAEDVASIEYGEDYREALVAACTAKVFKKYQQYADHNQWIGDYEYEARKLADAESDDMAVVQARTGYRE